MTQSRRGAATDPLAGGPAHDRQPRAGLHLIVPVMKARVPVEVQLEFPLPENEEPILEAFAGNLFVSYAIEGADPADPADFAGAAGGAGSWPGRRHEYVARRHCRELGVLPEVLRDRAVANLRIRRPDLSFSWYPDVRAVAVTAGHDLEAGLVLDEGFCEKLSQDLEGDLVVAVPARDLFVATGTGHPDGVDKLRWVVDQIWADDRYMPPGGAEDGGPLPSPLEGAPVDRRHLLLSRDLLVWREAGWDVLAPAGAAARS